MMRKHTATSLGILLIVTLLSGCSLSGYSKGMLQWNARQLSGEQNSLRTHIINAVREDMDKEQLVDFFNSSNSQFTPFREVPDSDPYVTTMILTPALIYDVEVEESFFRVQALVKVTSSYGGGWKAEQMMSHACVQYAAELPASTLEDIVVTDAECFIGVESLPFSGSVNYSLAELAQLES